MYRNHRQEGGPSQQEQIMQIIQMFAEMNGIDPEMIMQKLQELPPEQQQQAIQEMAQAVQQGAQGGQPGMEQQMAPDEQAMMAEGGAWYYGGYMNHPMMSFGQNQHPVTLHRRGGSAGRYKEEGGEIKIDSRKKGTFKAQATKMGMSVQEAANHILRNKSQYSPTMVKKANFAKNFAKEFGGQLDERDVFDIFSGGQY